MSDQGDTSSAVLSLVTNFTTSDVTSDTVGRSASALETLLGAAAYVYLNVPKVHLNVSSSQEPEGAENIRPSFSRDSSPGSSRRQ